MDFSSPTHRLSSPREDCTPGRHQEVEVDTSWTIFFWGITSETVWRICRQCLEQMLSLSTTYCLRKCALDWRKSRSSNRINQEGIWSSMVDDRKCKIFWKKNSVKSKGKMRMWKCFDIISRNVFQILWMIWLGKSIGKQESHGLRRKLSIKWMNNGNGRM